MTNISGETRWIVRNGKVEEVFVLRRLNPQFAIKSELPLQNYVVELKDGFLIEAHIHDLYINEDQTIFHGLSK